MFDLEQANKKESKCNALLSYNYTLSYLLCKSWIAQLKLVVDTLCFCIVYLGLIVIISMHHVHLFSVEEDFHLHFYSAVHKQKKGPKPRDLEAGGATPSVTKADAKASGMDRPVCDPVPCDNNESKHNSLHRNNSVYSVLHVY